MSNAAPLPALVSLRSCAAGLSMLLASAAAPALAQEPVNITFFIWAGSNQGVVPMEVIEKYRAENPHVTIEVLESNNAITYPKMVAARMTTPDDPLVNCGFFNIDSMNKGDFDDMWVEITPDLVPRMTAIRDGYVRPEGKGLGYMMSTIGIMYNKDKVTTPPDSWEILWTPRNDKSVTFFDYDSRMPALAARLNGGDERNVDPGFEVWSKAVGNLRALVDSNDAVKNLVVSGDALYAPWFAASATVWINEGAPLGFAVPKEGLLAFPLYLTITKGSTPAEQKVCGDLLNELLSPENSGRYGELVFSTPLVEDAVLTDAQKANPLLSLEAAENAILLDYQYIGEVAPEWRERWDREVKFLMR